MLIAAISLTNVFLIEQQPESSDFQHPPRNLMKPPMLLAPAWNLYPTAKPLETRLVICQECIVDKFNILA